MSRKESNPRGRRRKNLSAEYQSALNKNDKAIATFKEATLAYRGREIGDTEFLAAKAKHKAAMADFDRAFAKEAKKKNPAVQASEAYTDFHGRPSEEVVTVQTKVHYHKHLAACGELRKLIIKPVGKLFTVTLSGFKKALLAFNEKRTQLFIEGGDQAVDLKQFGIKTPHETETLGEVKVIEYFTIKDHLGNEGGKAIYVHKFSKPYPVLIYNVLDQQLTFSGGSYKVLAEGIDK